MRREPSMKPASVLVIDDDADFRELVRMILEHAGFVVQTAADGIDVLDPGRGWSAILLDLNMPIFDGGRLVEYWQMTDPELLRRVIFLTGFSRLAAARSLPVSRWLRKPFTPEELVEAVRDCAVAAGEPHLESPSRSR